MDSMRSLNTSLPSSSAYSQPPEQLLQAFKAAALSVTNLYKSAVTDQSQARQAGYQEAIEDLLHFLDRENLGLGDGEGWKVRQWATERVEGTAATADSDDDDKRARSSSPLVNRKEQQDNVRLRQDSVSTTARVEPTTAEQLPLTNHAQSEVTTSVDSNTIARPPVFTFSAGPQFPSAPQELDMETSDSMSMNSASVGDTTGVGLSVLSRNAWTNNNRHNNSIRRSSTRESNATFTTKRKLHFPDFFDISGLNGRDMFGGGKRGRFA